MANLSNINNILRVSSSGVGINKNNIGPSELDIESAGADIIDMTRTGQKTYRFAISGASAFSLFDVAANEDRLTIDSSGNSTFAGGITVAGSDGQFNHNIILEGSIFHKDDTNTLIGFPADDTIALTTSATERMRIDSSGNATFAGNVGIGVTGTPVVKLEVDTNSTFAGAAQFGNSTGNRLYILNDDGGNRILLDAISSGGASNLIFANGGSESMRIDSSGNVGINETSPDAKLDVELTDTNTYSSTALNTATIIAQTTNTSNINSQASVISLRATGYAGSTTGVVNLAAVQAGNANSADFVIQTRNAGTYGERMRITSAGNVEIKGTNSGAGNTQMKLIFDNTDTTVQANQLMGGIEFKSADGSDIGAGIKSSINTYFTGTGGQTDMRFATAGADANNAERMRIDSSGKIKIGNNIPIWSGQFGGALFLKGDNSTADRYGQLAIVNSTGSILHAGLTINNNGTGTFGSSITATAYNTSSDYRLKEDLQDFAGLDMVSKIPVYDFKWKSDESRSYGVMAHELQEVLPDAVTGEKDAEEMQGVDYSKIVPLLVKSIQELKADNDSLKARIETLENN